MTNEESKKRLADLRVSIVDRDNVNIIKLSVERKDRYIYFVSGKFHPKEIKNEI